MSKASSEDGVVDGGACRGLRDEALAAEVVEQPVELRAAHVEGGFELAHLAGASLQQVDEEEGLLLGQAQDLQRLRDLREVVRYAHLFTMAAGPEKGES